MRILIAAFPLIALLAPPAFAQTAPAKPPARARTVVERGYSLAFVDADVRRVVDAVMGSMLSVNYSVDSGVQGNITLRTTEPVSREALIPLLETALRSVNAVVVKQGDAYRILPRAEARARAPVSDGAGDSVESAPGFATEVVTLKQASAREIARVLEQFLGKEIVSGTNAATNQVMITGTAEERRAAREIVQRFDVDSLANMTFELFRLENVDADTINAELQRVFQPPYDILGSRVRLIPLPRLRSILAIAADRADIAKLEPWIKRLDTGVSGKRRLYSYAVQNGRAQDIASALQKVLGSGSGGGNEGQAQSQSAPSGSAPQPEQAIGAQTPLPGTSNAASSPLGGVGPRIVPSDTNNSLLIFADGEEYDFIRDALTKLDQPVAQVLIEATLAEVTLTDDFRFGVNFSALRGDTKVTQSNSTSPLPTAIFPGFSVSVIGNTAQGVLNTLQGKTNVRVLSAPKLIVLNNETATLQVGDQVPIVTQQSQSVSAPGAPIVNTVDLRDTGVILKVTPRMNDSGTITLDVAQEVSDVATTTSSGINSPTIQQRRLTTTVSTQNGQMIALGGLIRDRRTKSKQGIPLLSQIPVVGGLFGTQADNGSRTELIMLLTPTIIRTPLQVRGVVEALIDGLDATRPLVNESIRRQVGGKPLP